MMKKRVAGLLLALVMILSLVPTTAFAATEVASGTCGAEGDGSNLTWTLDDAGTLTISGTGAMANYSDLDGAPWSGEGDIKTIVIESGVTSIGDYAFYDCADLSNVYYGGTEAEKEAITIGDGNAAIQSATWHCADEVIVSAPKLSLSKTDGKIKLAWGAVKGATRYWIYRSTDGKNFKFYDGTANTGYTNSSVSSGTKYYYKVKAVRNVDGTNYVSDFSNMKSTVPLTTPKLSVSKADGKVKLTWGAVKGATKYWIYRSTDGKNFKFYDGTANTSYTNSSVSSGTKYYYKVKAIKNIDGTNYDSSFSGMKSVVPLTTPTLSISQINCKITLKWGAVKGATRYWIYRSTDGKNFKFYDGTANTSYTNSSATIGTKYYYRVKAVKKVNGTNYVSSLSSVKSAVIEKPKGLTDSQYKKIVAYLDSFYSSVGSFSVHMKPDLFANKSIKNLETTIWESLIAVRKKSLIDLHMSYYNFKLRVTDVDRVSATEIKVEAWEDCDQQFKGVSVLSKEFSIEHHFTLVRGSDSVWRIKEHKSECNPFYVFSYDKANNSDAKLSVVLNNIKKRQAQLGGTIKTAPTCNHPYNRKAAVSYAHRWSATRNPSYFAYDKYGGNCMNFASQTMHAGGIHETRRWYWDDAWDVSNSWINVVKFTDYATSASYKELACDANANYYSGQPGDLLLIGIDHPRNHATVICDVVKDRSGKTIDYLLCSNTSNLENFPASAYYYTNQRLIRIFGWND